MRIPHLQRLGDRHLRDAKKYLCIYALAGRQAEGLLHSLFDLMRVDLPVPEHSTVCRRKGQLSITLSIVPRTGSVHLVVDATGNKVYGEGEWKTRQHGVSQRRTWRKLHMGDDEATDEILAGCRHHSRFP